MAKNSAAFNPLNMTALTQDAFRTLRMNISFSGGDRDIQTVAVTSAVPNEGKTSVSIGLGVAMAEAGRRTLIVECDCRKPAVGNRLKLRPERTWLDILYHNIPIEEAVVETACPRLFFLDVEPGLVHSIELLSSYRFWRMVESLKEQFGFIIFDTPPVGAFIDAAVLAEHTDGTLMVVNSGSKEVKLVKASIEQLKKAGGNFLGVVLNKVKVSRTSSYYRYGDYYYRDKGGAKKQTGFKDSSKESSSFQNDWDQYNGKNLATGR